MAHYSWFFSGHNRSWARPACGALLVLAAAGLLLVLKEFPYSSVRWSGVDPTETTRAPASTEFTIGPLHWPIASLQQDPGMRVFRDAMRATCGDARGLAAAACATRVLRKRTPVGQPSTEYVNVSFDPVLHLERHLAGEPGHCLTRSAIVATQLLSTGTPARVLQMLPLSGKGHTLVEVWDDSLGWTVIDPSNDGYLTGAARHAAAADLLANSAAVEWKRFGSEPASAAESERQNRYFRGLLTGNVLYPEPWLYLRLGQRVAPWPFRGHYARVGPPRFVIGPAQQLLVVAIPTLLLLGVALVLTGRGRPASVRSTAWAGAVPARARSVDDFDAVPRG